MYHILHLWNRKAAYDLNQTATPRGGVHDRQVSEHMLLRMSAATAWNALRVWLIGAYPVVLRKSQESRRQEVAQLGKQRKPGLFTGTDISLLVSKTGSNEPPLRWVWLNRRWLLKHDLPFLTYPRGEDGYLTPCWATAGRQRHSVVNIHCDGKQVLVTDQRWHT